MKPTFNKERPISWSSISSFEWNKEQWYQSYILGKRTSSPEMEFGSMIDKKIQNDPLFMPALPRYPLMQHKLTGAFSKIPLVGLPDGLCLDTFQLADYKTGKKPWDQKRADETGQLTMYLLLIYLSLKIKPEEFTCFIHWLPTQDSGKFEISLVGEEVKTFETKRTMKEILVFGSRIIKTVNAMEAYVDNYELA